MEAALEQRPFIEGTATEIDEVADTQEQRSKSVVPADEGGAGNTGKPPGLPAVKDVMSQPAV